MATRQSGAGMAKRQSACCASVVSEFLCVVLGHSDWLAPGSMCVTVPLQVFLSMATVISSPAVCAKLLVSGETYKHVRVASPHVSRWWRSPV